MSNFPWSISVLNFHDTASKSGTAAMFVIVNMQEICWRLLSAGMRTRYKRFGEFAFSVLKGKNQVHPKRWWQSPRTHSVTSQKAVTLQSPPRDIKYRKKCWNAEFLGTFNRLKHSGYYMYHLFESKSSEICPQSACVVLRMFLNMKEWLFP
jgi:hypothetical protein